MGLKNEFFKHYLRLERLSEDVVPLVEETGSADNNTPVAAIITFLVLTVTAEPAGTYSSN